MGHLRPILIAVVAPIAGCTSLIGNHIPVEMQVVEPRSSFIDEALGHRYSDWYSIVGANTPCFGARIGDGQCIANMARS